MISPDLTRLAFLLTASVEPLTAIDTQATPSAHPGHWSIQQIVEHLLLTYRLTSSNVTIRLEKGTPTRATPSLVQRLGQFTLIHIGYFPKGRKAPEVVCPGSTSVSALSGAALALTLQDDLTRMDALIAQAEARFGPQVQAVSHQVLGPLTAHQWTRFHLVHGLHHLKQIQAIRNAAHPAPA